MQEFETDMQGHAHCRVPGLRVLGVKGRQARSCRVNAREAWSLMTEHVDQVFDLAYQVAGVLTERHPQDAIVKGLLHAFVMAQGSGHRRLAIAARTTQRGRDGHRLLTPL